MAQPNTNEYSTVEAVNGGFIFVDAADFERVSKYDWYICEGRNTKYARATVVKYSQMFIHTFLMNTPEGFVVDHIDGNGLNNCRSNLRIVTHSQNLSNKSKKSGTSSKYIGVTWRAKNNKWQVQARSALFGIKCHVGMFSCEKEAALAYNEFCLRFNPTAKLNVTED